MATRQVNQNTASSFLNKLYAHMLNRTISVPVEFKEQCIAIDALLSEDRSGLVNSLLDFAIASGQVTFSVETSNPQLSEVLNRWLNDINNSLLGKIPTGVDALSKQYYTERWKGSSLLLLRSIWEKQDDFLVPTKMWFVDGKDVLIEDDDTIKELGSQKYKLFLSSDKQIKLPANTTEKIFVQKPYERWGAEYPTPFLIKRGIFYNLQLLHLLATKSENVIGRAIEYLMLMKKGSAELAKLNRPEFTYSQEDFNKIKDNIEELLSKKQSDAGVPAYYTNFDTEMEHLIPDYEKALKSSLYVPIEKRILGGLGFIEVVEGLTSSRKDAILNPRVFAFEVHQAVEDFKSLLVDILKTVIQENKTIHKKYANVDILQIHSTPIKSFMTEEAKTLLRSFYDRGLLSKRTATEVGLDLDFDAEVERRKQEKTDKLEELMFAPVIQNNGQIGANGQPITPDKTGPEAKNFNQATICSNCNEPLEQAIDDKFCANCGHEAISDVFEEAPYKKTSDLPDSVKQHMTTELQRVYLEVFNSTFKKYGETRAFKTAWAVIKKLAKKDKDGKWVKKDKINVSSIDKLVEDGTDLTVLNQLKMEILTKQTKLLDKMLNENTRQE
jgi:cation transport regulator